jgi:hypothetical protein
MRPLAARGPGAGIAVPQAGARPRMPVCCERPVGTCPGRGASKGAAVEPCREGAMTAWHLWARSRQAGALLGAVAVLVAGCTAAGASGARAGRAGPARHSIAASPPGRVIHRIAGTAGPGSAGHGSRPGTAGASSLAPCAPPLGGPGVGRAGAASRLPVAVPACLCCRWCACAWACCGCGTGRWPGSRLAWRCCPRWLGPPEGVSPPIPPACGPGCGSFACPVGPRAPGGGPARSAAGSVQARPPGS